MDNDIKEYMEIEIACDVADEPESEGLLAHLRENGFVQDSLDIRLPTVVFKGKFFGTFEELLEKCKNLNVSWSIRQLKTSSANQ